LFSSGGSAAEESVDDSPYLFDSRHDDPCASLGGSTHDPTDPEGRLLFNVLAMVAEFEPT